MTQNHTIELSIAGMSCTGCSGRVQAALEKVPGVKTVRVDLASGRVTIEIEATAPTAESLAETVNGLGYEARPAGD